MNSFARFPLIAQAAAESNTAIYTFAVYIFGVMVLAWLSNRLLQSKSFVSEYFLGSRSLGVWAFALTFAATSSSGGSFIGFPSLVYTHGWVVALWIGSYMIVPIVSMGLLAKRINQVARRTGAITIPDVLRDRFESRAFGTLAIVLIVFFMSFNLIAQFKGGSVILQTLLTGVPQFESAKTFISRAIPAGIPLISQAASDNPGYLLCLLVFTVAVVVYTAYGGFRAVVWTDVMQGFVMVGGVVLMLPLAIYAVGGLDAATAEMAEMTPPQNVMLRLETAAAASKSIPIPNNSWLVQQRDGKQRLFRTLLRAEILKGEKTAHLLGDVRAHDRDIIPAIEITFDKHVKKVVKEQKAKSDFQEIAELVDIQVRTQARLTVSSASPAAKDSKIAAGTIVEAKDEAGGQSFYRTLNDATLASGETEAVVPPASLWQRLFGEPKREVAAIELTAAEAEGSSAKPPVAVSARIVRRFEADKYKGRCRSGRGLCDRSRPEYGFRRRISAAQPGDFILLHVDILRGGTAQQHGSPDGVQRSQDVAAGDFYGIDLLHPDLLSAGDHLLLRPRVAARLGDRVRPHHARDGQRAHATDRHDLVGGAARGRSVRRSNEHDGQLPADD